MGEIADQMWDDAFMAELDGHMEADTSDDPYRNKGMTDEVREAMLVEACRQMLRLDEGVALPEIIAFLRPRLKAEGLREAAEHTIGGDRQAILARADELDPSEKK